MLKKILLVLLIIPLSFAQQSDIYQAGDNVNHSFSLTSPLPSQENHKYGTYTKNDVIILLFHDLRYELIYNETIQDESFTYIFNKKISEPGNYYIQATVVSMHSKYNYGEWSNYTYDNNSESYYFTVEGNPTILDLLNSYLSSFSEKIVELNFMEYINNIIIKIKSKVGMIKI